MQKLTDEHFNLNQEMQDIILQYGSEWVKKLVSKFKKLEKKKNNIQNKITKKLYRKKYFKYCALQEEIKYLFDMDYTWYCNDPYFYRIEEYDFGLSHKLWFDYGWKDSLSAFNPPIIQIEVGDRKYNEKISILIHQTNPIIIDGNYDETLILDIFEFIKRNYALIMQSYNNPNQMDDIVQLIKTKENDIDAK